jgi:hypothetical protein
MAWPRNIAFPIEDKVNENIWRYLCDGDLTPLEDLNTSKLGLEMIRKEILSGCSPCPDVLTQGFGTRPSVMFVATVYGLIHEYLGETFDRRNASWREFATVFYHRLIRHGKGIYGRLERLYGLTRRVFDSELDFCFTELVKTVLARPNGGVTGIDAYWPRYFAAHEQHFLRQRLAEIYGRCIIFTFSEMSTFHTVAILGKEEDLLGVHTLPKNVEVLHHSDPSSPIVFRSWMSSRGNPKVRVSGPGAGASYTRTIAHQTVLGVQDRDLFVVPLPHPSGANNRHWPETAWHELAELLGKVPF